MIPEADGQERTKKGTWRKIKEDPDVGKDGDMPPMTNLEAGKKLVPMTLRIEDRPKIRNLNKIQDTYDVVEGNNCTDIMITGNLLPNKKVRWKDIAGSNSATKKDGKD